MGGGNWTSSDWSKTVQTRSTLSRDQIFTQTKIHKLFNPRGIKIRESRDSKDHPESNAIILGLDVTGSMGIIAEKVAKEGLGTLVAGILDRKPVNDPQIMIMAIGDIVSDEAPLQVSQFESDIRISEQLASLWLEGNGGGNSSESYDLPWYFAATRTSIDCFEKRNKKGKLITIGDELPPYGVTKGQLKEYFAIDEASNYKPEQLLKLAQKSYEVFHVIVEQGNFASRHLQQVKAGWRDLLGKRAILLDDYNHISEVILSVLDVSEGKDPNDVVKSWEKKSIKESVRHALFD